MSGAITDRTQSFRRWLLYSDLHIPLVAAAFLFSTYSLLGHPWNPALILAAAASSLASILIAAIGTGLGLLPQWILLDALVMAPLI